MTPQSTRRSIETNSPVLDASEPAAGGIVLKENKIYTPPSPSPSSSDSRLEAKYVRKDELAPRDLDSEHTKHVSQDESGSDTSFSTLKQRVSAMAQSVPPRQQVSDEDSTYTSDDTHGVCEDDPEVSHPKGNASPSDGVALVHSPHAQPTCIDSSCTALICAGSASAVGSAVFGTEGAPAELSSSTSSTNSSSSSSSNTSRSSSIRGSGGPY